MKEEIEFVAGKIPPSVMQKISSFNLDLKEIQKKVEEMAMGFEVPVKIVIDKEKKTYELKVKTPPVSSLIKKELGMEKIKLSEEDRAKGIRFVADLKMEQIVKIAKIKKEDLLAKDLKNAVKIVLGSIVSMPISVEGKKAKEIIKEVDEGKWDYFIKE